MCGDEDILYGRSPKGVVNARKKILKFVNVLKKITSIFSLILAKSIACDWKYVNTALDVLVGSYTSRFSHGKN